MELSCFTVLGNGPPRQCTGKDVSLLKTHEKEMFLAKANPHMFILRFCYKVLILPFTTRAVISQQVREGRGPGSWGPLRLDVNVFVANLTLASGPALSHLLLLTGSSGSQTE